MRQNAATPEQVISNPENAEQLVQFRDDTERALFAEAKLGEDAINFLGSPLGQLLAGYAKQTIEEGRDELEKLLPWKPWRRRRVRQLQFDIAVARQFNNFIYEAIQTGEQAYQNLKAYNS